MNWYDCIGFQLPQAAMRDGGQCPLRDAWENKIRKLCSLDVTCSLSALCYDMLLFPKSIDKTEIQRIFIASLRHKRLAMSRATAYSMQQNYVCKKQRVEQKLILETFVTVILKYSSSKISEKMGIFGSSGRENTHSWMFPSDLEIIPFLLAQHPFFKQLFTKYDSNINMTA